MMSNKQSLNETPCRFVGVSFLVPYNGEKLYALKIRAGYSDLEEAEIHINKIKDTLFNTHVREINQWFDFCNNSIKDDAQDTGNYLLSDPTYRQIKFACTAYKDNEGVKKQIKVYSLHSDAESAQIAARYYHANDKDPIFVSEVGKWTPFPNLYIINKMDKGEEITKEESRSMNGLQVHIGDLTYHM